MNKLFLAKPRTWLNAGLSGHLCDRYQDQIMAANLHIVTVLNITGSVVVGCLLLLSFLFSISPALRLLWFFFGLVLVLLHFCCQAFAVLSPRRVLACLYAVVCALYLCAALLGGCIYTESGAVLLCLLLVALPQLILDRFWHANLPGVLIECLFLALNFTYCPAPIQMVNLVYSVSALGIGMLLSHYSIANRVKEFQLLDQLSGQRDTDGLTNLLTRRAVQEQIIRLLDYGDVPCALLLIDIDNFKSINDTYGHSYGDQVLEMLADVLRTSFRSTDLVGRLGGDEFLILLHGTNDPTAVSKKSRELLTELSRRSVAGKTALHPTISLGVALSPQHGTEFAELYRKADHALYSAKHAGKNTYELFGN